MSPTFLRLMPLMLVLMFVQQVLGKIDLKGRLVILRKIKRLIFVRQALEEVDLL
jgi:hypothetical protein